MTNIADKVQTDVDAYLAGITYMLKAGDVEGLYQVNQSFKRKNPLIRKYLCQDKEQIYTSYQRAIDSACMSLVGDRMREAGL